MSDPKSENIIDTDIKVLISTYTGRPSTHIKKYASPKISNKILLSRWRTQFSMSPNRCTHKSVYRVLVIATSPPFCVDKQVTSERCCQLSDSVLIDFVKG